MSFFRDASVTHQEKTIHLTAQEGRALESSGNYWHESGKPSTWLAVAVFRAAREKTAGAPEAVALELAARAMGITAEELRGSISFYEQYMGWRDGDPNFKV